MSTLCKSEADELTAYYPREKRTNHGMLPGIQPSDNFAPDSINLLRKDSLPMTRENSHNTSLGQSGGDATENAVNHTESKVVTRPGSVISPANGVSARGDPGTAHGSHASLEETRQSYSREDLNESAFSFKVLSNSPKYRRQSFASVSDSQNPGSTQKIRPEVQRIPGIKVTAAGRPCESEGFDRRSSSSVPSMLQTHHWLPPPPPPPQPPLLEYSGWPPPRDVPPPPPPPPPPENPHFQQFSPSSGNVSPRAQGPGLTDSRLRAFVHRLEETQIQQNEHRELREQALTECHNLKTTRKRLREHRSKTRYMEAKLISELRQVCLNAKALDYETLFSLYEQVGDAQDVLGALEEDYEEEESRYNILEWQVEKKERDIVSDLLEDILELNILPQNPDGSLVEVPRKVTTPGGRSPEPLPGVSSGTFEFPEQFKSFHLADAGSQLGAEDQEIDPTELPNDEEAFSMISKRPDTPYTDHVPELVRAKAKVLEGNSDPDPRRASEPITYKDQMLKPPEQPRRPRSENDFASMEQRWPSVHAHVDQWMRETLDESQFEKFIAKLRTGRQIAKARTGSEDIDKRTWWELFKQFWSQAGSDGDPGHENEKSDAEGVNVSLNLEKGI